MLLWKLILLVVIACLLCVLAIKFYLVVTLGMCQCLNQLHGKTVIITGANAGIGKETALDLAHRGARIILACRNVCKANTAKAEIIKKTGNTNIVARELNLASLTSVRNFAAGVLETESRLDVLINNAGCVSAGKTLTEDGLEYQMQSNYLGHFLLTNLLLGLLKKSAPSRIINVSSLGHTMVSNLDFANLNAEISYNSNSVYSTTKLCQIISARYLAPHIIKDGVTVNCLHPGVVHTEIFKDFLPSEVPNWLYKPINFISGQLFKTPKEGAQTSIHLAVADEIADITGKYFSDCKIIKPSKLAEDDELANKLWEVSETLVKLKPKERHL